MKTGVQELISLSLSAVCSHCTDFDLYFLDKQTSSELSKSVSGLFTSLNLLLIFTNTISTVVMHAISYCNYRTQKTKRKSKWQPERKNIIFKGMIIGVATGFPISTTEAKKTVGKKHLQCIEKKYLATSKSILREKNTFQRISDKLMFLLKTLTKENEQIL